ncbi:MAG: hypothetical protein ACC647_10335 [Anaerolineales bacterium]
MLARLIHLALVLYLGRPLGQLYLAFLRVAERAPQEWIWATVIALAMLIGLRNLSSQHKSTPPADPQAQYQPESLESWLVLLQERKRGGYFRWRLASQLADLHSQIGDYPQLDPSRQVQDYLQIGHDRRTIRAGEAMAANSLDLEDVVGYLERSMRAENES